MQEKSYDFFFQAVCEHPISCDIYTDPSAALGLSPLDLAMSFNLKEDYLGLQQEPTHSTRPGAVVSQPYLEHTHIYLLPCLTCGLQKRFSGSLLILHAEIPHQTHLHSETQGYCTPVNTSYNKLTLGKQDLPRNARLEQRVLLWMFIWRNVMPELCLTWGNHSGALEACMKNPYKSQSTVGS